MKSLLVSQRSREKRNAVEMVFLNSYSYVFVVEGIVWGKRNVETCPVRRECHVDTHDIA